MSNKVIVAQYPALASYIGRELLKQQEGGDKLEHFIAAGMLRFRTRGSANRGGEATNDSGDIHPEMDIPIVGTPTRRDLEGKIVYGDVPIQLAYFAKEAYLMEYPGADQGALPPRDDTAFTRALRSGAALKRYGGATEEQDTAKRDAEKGKEPPPPEMPKPGNPNSSPPSAVQSSASTGASPTPGQTSAPNPTGPTGPAPAPATAPKAPAPKPASAPRPAPRPGPRPPIPEPTKIEAYEPEEEPEENT